MKIIGSNGLGNWPTYIVEIHAQELSQIAHGNMERLDIHRLASGTKIDVSALWNRLHGLEEGIRLAGTDAPRNLRSLADLLETQVQAVIPPKEDPQP